MKPGNLIQSSHNGLLILLLLLFQLRPEKHPTEIQADLPMAGFSSARFALEGTVKVETIFQDGDGFSMAKKGTGAIINKNGLIVTNFHNIGEAQHIEVTLFDGRRRLAKMVGSDLRADLALLKIQPGEFNPLPLGNSETLSLGEKVYAIGNPHHLDFSLTSGIISGFNRRLTIIPYPRPFERFIQTDAPINSGCSGGPLLNAKGELIGINTAIVTNSGHFEGYSFAQPVEIVKEFLEKILSENNSLIAIEY